MGEAVYYAKWKYETKKQAKTAAAKISKFIKETGKAHDYWQENRGKTPDEFWPTFKKKFPACYNFLACYKYAGGDCNNGLSGVISIGDDYDVGAEVDGLDVRYSANTWHFADWSQIVEWLAWGTTAKSSGWVSDEHANLFDCIEMEEVE